MKPQFFYLVWQNGPNMITQSKPYIALFLELPRFGELSILRSRLGWKKYPKPNPSHTQLHGSFVFFNHILKKFIVYSIYYLFS